MDTEDRPEPSVAALTAQQSAELLKLQAETSVIQRQLSFRSDLREWLKALTGLAAIGALVWSMVTGVNQLKQGREDKQQELIERALNRIGSNNALERLVGVNSIRAFVSGADRQKSSIALMSLASGMVEEEDMPVRAAMLTAMGDFAPTTKPQPDLQYAVSVLLNGNRNLLNRAVLSPDLRIMYSGLLPQTVDQHLSDLAKAALLLVRKGASNKDFTGLYCSSCDFSELFLQNANFENSWLIDANFERANLQSASFVNTALKSADFTRSDLRHAHFSGFPLDRIANATNHPVIDLRTMDFSPTFACSDLREASFEGLVFWGVSDRGADWEVARGPRFRQAKLEGTDFSNLFVYLASSVSEHDALATVLKKAGLDVEARGLTVRLLSRKSTFGKDHLFVRDEEIRPAKIVIFPFDEHVVQLGLTRLPSAKEFLASLDGVFYLADTKKAKPQKVFGVFDKLMRVTIAVLEADSTTKDQDDEEGAKGEGAKGADEPSCGDDK